jgi:hypothetical protein
VITLNAEVNLAQCSVLSVVGLLGCVLLLLLLYYAAGVVAVPVQHHGECHCYTLRNVHNAFLLPTCIVRVFAAAAAAAAAATGCACVALRGARSGPLLCIAQYAQRCLVANLYHVLICCCCCCCCYCCRCTFAVSRGARSGPLLCSVQYAERCLVANLYPVLCHCCCRCACAVS